MYIAPWGRLGQRSDLLKALLLTLFKTTTSKGTEFSRHIILLHILLGHVADLFGPVGVVSCWNKLAPRRFLWALVILSLRRTAPEARAFPGCDFEIQQELAKKGIIRFLYRMSSQYFMSAIKITVQATLRADCCHSE